MDLNINGHDVSATVVVDGERLLFSYRHPESGRLDQLAVHCDELIGTLGSLGAQGLPPNGRMPGEGPPPS